MDKIKLLASQLAKHYSDEHTAAGACACTGLSGVCIDCTLWWEIFLRSYSKEYVEKIMQLHLAAVDIKSHYRWDDEMWAKSFNRMVTRNMDIAMGEDDE